MTVRQSLALIAMGLLFGGFGLVFLLNLFGVMDEAAKNGLRSTAWARRIPPWKWITSPDEQEELRNAKRWGQPGAAAWVLVGVAIVVAGTVNLVRALLR
jgi:hypothetical protein